MTPWLKWWSICRDLSLQNTSFYAKSQGGPYDAPHVTVSRFFLARAVKIPRNLLPSLHPPSLSPLFAGPKNRMPKVASHDLRAGSFENGCLCSILHGPLQLQIWTAFLLPACLFPTAARQSATHLLTLNYLSLPKDHLPPARFCSHFELVSRLYIAVLSSFSLRPHLHRRAAVAITPQTPPSPPLCGCS
jgi:hypothetical protein